MGALIVGLSLLEYDLYKGGSFSHDLFGLDGQQTAPLVPGDSTKTIDDTLNTDLLPPNLDYPDSIPNDL